MTRKEIYLEAARRVAECKEKYACCAITDLTGNEQCNWPRRDFAEMFQPQGAEMEGTEIAWLGFDGDKPGEARHRRVVALCLAACALGGE